MIEIFWLVMLTGDTGHDKKICKTPTQVFEMLSAWSDTDSVKWSQFTFAEKLQKQWLEDATVEPICFYGEEKKYE